jgi:hypothetical protein
LGALEKKDGEELSRLRLVQQDNILKLTTKLRDMEVEAAEVGLVGLNTRRNSIQNRKNYYQTLLNNGLSDWESGQQITKHLGTTLMPGVISFLAVAGGTSLIPRILGMANSTGGGEGTDSIKTFGEALRSSISHLSQISDSMALEANFQRREEGWQFSFDQSELELQELGKQIEAAEIRRDISVESRKLHDKTLEQQQEMFEFYKEKFSNLGLYTWLSTQLQRMYREAYQGAMTIARMAERAYRFERNDNTSVLLDGNYWDPTYAGLLSGEKLLNAIRHMELRYMETHSRSMEIDQAFSLTQISPEALLKLKATGECEFTVPELYFDLFYPGQYLRRIQSARLTIPCITGPYSNVSATLTLKGSKMRKATNLREDSLLSVNPSRSVAIATSTAQNDSGVFRLDFRDERYMPFEGAGAVDSQWHLQLPQNFRPFDYSTINDVILHISYTAAYDESFRNIVEDTNRLLSSLLPRMTLQRAFSVRQEFSQTFHRLLHSPLGEIIRMELSEKHFPLFLQGQRIQIVNAKLVVEIDENGFRNPAAGTIEVPSSMSLNLDIQGNGSALAAIVTLDKAYESNSVFSATISAGTFASFTPASGALGITLRVTNAGDLVPRAVIPGDPSALDDHKVKDIYLLIDYEIERLG